jgi:N6-L-threonylcarbamoyladenine synthase
MAILGIDTSCYTTSVALTEGGKIVEDLRIKLEVEGGGLGLRQSEALFKHTKNLPGLVDKAFRAARSNGMKIETVSVSTQPRRAEGSYMPVFLAGRSVASVIATSLGTQLVEVSHQEGHIAACAPDSGLSPGDSFIAVHISGGTTEVLGVEWGEDSMGIEILAATGDISAGQMIDRVGSALGLPFPAGPDLEALAAKPGGNGFRIPSSVVKGMMSFSGPCEAAIRGANGGIDRAEVARAVFDCIVKSVSKAVRAATEASGISTALIVGGVASNLRIRHGLAAGLEGYGVEVLFGKEELSSDNAVGVSYLGELWG